MTTAVRIIQRTEQASGIRRTVRGITGALGELHERVLAWSAAYYKDARSDRGRTV